MKLKKGDTVRVVYGKDRGREGKIERVYKKSLRVLIPGINMYKKHIKKTQEYPQGGVVELPRPIHISKVAFFCPKCKSAVRLGYKIENNKKIRICKKCGSQV